MAKQEKESCPKCASQNFAKALDKSNKRYCSNCQNVWVPGFEAKSSLETLLKKSQAEVNELRIEVSRLKAKLQEHEDTIELLQATPDEDELFD